MEPLSIKDQVIFPLLFRRKYLQSLLVKVKGKLSVGSYLRSTTKDTLVRITWRHAFLGIPVPALPFKGGQCILEKSCLATYGTFEVPHFLH